MKKTVFVAGVLVAVGSFAAPAFAEGNSQSNYGGYHCTTGMCSDNADLRQVLTGMQKAIDNIVNVDDATKIVQAAVNAGNLVNVGDTIDLANVYQFGDLNQTASNRLIGNAWGWNGSDFTDVSQSATNVVNSITGGIVQAVSQTAKGSQTATNAIEGTHKSSFEDLQQAATNVVNSVTADTSKTIQQSTTGGQYASNYIQGGKHGYDYLVGQEVEWSDEASVRTQAAVNAANLVNLDKLTGAITQYSAYNSQEATNSAVFSGWHAPVYDFGQSATNVANSVTVGEIDPKIKCTCFGGWEIDQNIVANQLSNNWLATAGDVTNAIQSATNVANSISIPTPATN